MNSSSNKVYVPQVHTYEYDQVVMGGCVQTRRTDKKVGGVAMILSYADDVIAEGVKIKQVPSQLKSF